MNEGIPGRGAGAPEAPVVKSAAPMEAGSALARARAGKETVADIALLLEGTYPYIRGGVSAWVHQIISGLPEIRFAIVFIGGEKTMYGPAQYPFPPNVTHAETHYLMSPDASPRPGARKGNRKAFLEMAEFHAFLRESGQSAQSRHSGHMPDETIASALGQLGSARGIRREDFLHSESAWSYITSQYRERCTEPSFVNYFWAVRAMHDPLFVLADIASGLPPVGAVHAISTGYAGLLGAMLRLRRSIPFLLTEHGIYTKERKIDLAQATWIHDHNDDVCNTLHDEMGYIRGMWIGFYEHIGRIAYGQAMQIVSLYEGNRQRQIADGAPPGKTRVITNGIDLQRYAPVLQRRSAEIPPVLGLVGRVVPIKDIKTFIRTVHALVLVRPDAEGWIVGPEDEDPAYAAECKDLVASLGLNDHVKFLGFQNVAEILPRLGLMVLTSISEALPLVVLEAFASGLPCLATDVGSCRELIEGRTEEDRALGPAGSVVFIADPEGAARAALELLNDAGRWHAAQKAGLERVRRYYNDRLMFDSYRDLYMQALGNSALPSSSSAAASASAEKSPVMEA